MCSLPEKLSKLAQIGGQLEHDITQEIAAIVANRYVGQEKALERATELLLVRGDPWALAFFDRIVKRVQENAGIYEIMAEPVDGYTPADSVEEALRAARRSIA